VNWIVILDGEMRAVFVYAEEAACLVSMLGEGATITNGQKAVWREGKEEQPAGESYDFVAETCAKRSR